MDKCPNCGNKLSSIDVLCPRCGALVEVVQVKKGAGPVPQNNAADSSIPVKKTPPQQNLIVYNEDLPETDFNGFTMDADKDNSSPVSGDIHSPSPISENFGSPSIISEKVQSRPTVADISPGRAFNSPPVAYPAGNEANKSSFISPGMIGEPAPAKPEAMPSFDSQDYTEDYLSILKNMRLPELENINDITPDPSSKGQTQDISESHPASAKHWLELEEVPENAVSEPDIPLSPSEPQALENTEHRYRSDRRRLAQTEKPRRSKAGRVLLMIFVWIVVSAALFGGFYFLDRYVKDTYGGYGQWIHDMSNGKIELNDSASGLPGTAYSGDVISIVY